LSVEAHVADLVEEQRSAVGELEAAALLLYRARKRAALVTEELALDQLRGDRGAVHFDEGAVRALRRAVDRARDELFAGAGLAGDQYAHAGRGDFGDLFFDASDRLRLTDHLFVAALLRFERADFGGERAALDRVLDGDQHALARERLLEKVGGAGGHRADRFFERGVTADHHHRDLVVVFADLLERGEPVHAGEADVEHDQIDRGRREAREQLFGGLQRFNRITFALEHHLERAADVALIVDDQDSPAYLIGCFGHCGVLLTTFVSERAPRSRTHFWRRGNPGTQEV
jgi:hypothetical protein